MPELGEELGQGGTYVRWTAAKGQTLSPTSRTHLVGLVLLGPHSPVVRLEIISQKPELVVASAYASSHPPCGYGMDCVDLQELMDLAIMERGSDIEQVIQVI